MFKHELQKDFATVEDIRDVMLRNRQMLARIRNRWRDLLDGNALDEREKPVACSLLERIATELDAVPYP